MSKIPGKVVKAYFGASGHGSWTSPEEIAITDASFEPSLNEVDTTDSMTEGTLETSTTTQQSTTSKLSGYLKAGGNVLKGKNSVFSIGGDTKAITSFGIDIQYSEVDVTDNSTTDPFTEFIVNRRKATIKFSAWVRDNEAELEIGSPLSLSANFGHIDATLSGSVVLNQANKSASIKDAVKVEYAGTINSILSEINALPALGSTLKGEIIWKTGTGDMKSTYGEVMITAVSINTEIKGVATVSYTWRWVGAITEQYIDDK